MSRRLLRFIVLSVVLALAGCGGSGHLAKQADYSGGAAPGEMLEQEAADSDEAPPAPPEAPEAPSPDGAEIRTATTSGRASAGQTPAPMRDTTAADKKRAQKETPVAERAPEGKPQSAPEAPKAPATQLLIYTADLGVAVRDVRASIDAVEKAAVRRGGYLVSREDNRITVRVPSAEFDATLQELMKLGELLHRNVSVQDVTDLYFDLEVRMKNLEIVKKRLEELLAKASTVSEALAVQRELERVSSELESLRGRLKLLRELILFSTITVVFQPLGTENLRPGTRLPFRWMDQLGLGNLLRLN